MNNNPNYNGDVINAGEFYFSETFLKMQLGKEKTNEFLSYASNYLREQKEKLEKEMKNYKYISPAFGPYVI